MSISGSGASAHGDVPTSLYLYYDKFNVLLYVGITSRGVKRNHEHSDTQPWWRYVARQEVTHLPSRQAALKAERETIIRRSPPFNRTHNPDHEELAAAYLLLHARAEEQRKADALAASIEAPRKKKKVAQSVATALLAQGPPPMSRCVLVPLDLVSRDGKFLRCHSRSADVAMTDTIDLVATRFDRFKVGPNVGSVMSLARGNRGIEMVLKGAWLPSVTAVSVVVHQSERVIYTLQFTIGKEDKVATALGTSGPSKTNIGKFSNGPLSRRLGAAQGGDAVVRIPISTDGSLDVRSSAPLAGGEAR